MRRVLVPVTAITLLLALAEVSSVSAARHAPSILSARSACSAGSVRAVIGGKVKCLHAGVACKKRYNSAYRHYGFVCVSGHLRRVTTPPPPPSPPPPPPTTPPPPPAKPGHYKGTTSQNEDFELDVSSDGTGATNVKTGQVNESCNPDTLGIYGGNLTLTGFAPIDSSGNFKIDITFNGEIVVEQNTDPTTDHLTITGHFSGSTASGTFLETTQFTDSGTAYTCSSNPQTWTATLTG